MLLVVGDRDADFAPNAAAFASRFPVGMVRVAHLPEAGHAANIEQPREFEAAITGFARLIGYLPAMPARAGGVAGPRLMTTLGGALVVGGIGLLAAAIFLNGGDGGGDSPLLAAPAPAEDTPVAATPTPEEATAGTRTAGPLNAGGAGASPSAAASPTAIPTATGTTLPATATATPTTRPAGQAAPANTPTPAPTATPTEEPTPEPTATPTGPYAAISGPTAAEVGEPAVFYDASAPHDEVLKQTWTTPTGTVSWVAGVSVSFPSPGCYTVALTALFKDGTSQTASHAVSVGGVSCN
jgi:hypothetical protein